MSTLVRFACTGMQGVMAAGFFANAFGAGTGCESLTPDQAAMCALLGVVCAASAVLLSGVAS